MDEVLLTRNATKRLCRCLDVPNWGYSIADCLRRGDQVAVDEHLFRAVDACHSDDAVANTVLVARAATPEVAFRYLRWASSRSDRVVAIRVCFIFGELRDIAAAEIIEQVLDRHPYDDSVLNAALWALGKIRYAISPERLSALRRREQLLWRLRLYIREVDGTHLGQNVTS